MTETKPLSPPPGNGAALGSQIFAALCILGTLLLLPTLDNLSATLLLLTTFLFAVVCRYAARYMHGDPGQPRFTLWLCLTGACVFALILAQNLLVFAVAWSAISLSLHQLLTFYPKRAGARMAARKKFLISRLGDVCLAGALFLTHQQFGTWDFQAIFTAAAKIGTAPASTHWLCALLAFAALLKSAQFPFHSWLPDTMETPTPVSALMHAGIINAGGILVMRLSPLISLSEGAMLALAIVGGLTAAFASITMLTQASVKRCLAFSTIAQMGFMMLECGLGATELALLHLVAHSLYKAHAFLSTGSVVSTTGRPAARPVSTAAFALALGAAVGIGWLAASVLGVSPLHQPVLSGIVCLAIAQLLWSSWSPAGFLLAAVFSAAYFALDRVAGLVITPGPQAAPAVAAPLLALFVLLALAQSQLPRISRTPLGQKLYVHARNGFYLNTLANRFTAALWPINNLQRNA